MWTVTQARGRFARTLGVAVAAVALTGPAPAAAGPLSKAPTCFGAAARDAAQPCSNPELRFSVSPLPDDAVLQPSSACTLTNLKGPPNRVCSFGVPKAKARATIGLLGDSHAPAWRAAIDVLARAQRWRGLTVRRSSCPFTYAQRYTDKASSDSCFSWIRATLAFFARHPEIHTVFMVNSAAYPWVATNGLDAHDSAVAGFKGALSALPPTVTKIIVLRDNPQATDFTLPCVDRARRRYQRADVRCARDRASALLPDAPFDAATQLSPDRFRTIDLTPRFCDERLCFPVIGGALVYKDKSHITLTFSETLGPAVTAAYRALGLPPA